MPYDGLFSFLQCAEYEVRVRVYACQCPMTGFFHFYNRNRKLWQTPRIKVTMPYDGLFSFLRLHKALCEVRGKVSMPYDGLFSFLPMLTVENTVADYVSMPYDGLFSFLRRYDRSWDSCRCGCQCPMTGFFHFYLNHFKGGKK